MSCKLNRRNVPRGKKVELLHRQPLPEPAVTTSSADSWGSYMTMVPSAASRCSKDDDFDWNHSTCDSSLLGQSTSSFMSWADDVELGMTQKVQHMMDEVDRCLYGEELDVSSLQSEQVQECEQWKHKFLHLRVVGRGLGTRCSDDSVHIPAEAEYEEVIASHGCYEDGPADAHCSKDHDRLMKASLDDKTLQDIKDKVCAHVWSEVAKRLSERTVPACHLSPNTEALVVHRDTFGSAKRPSERVFSAEPLATRHSIHSLQRRLLLDAVDVTDGLSQCNLPALAVQHRGTAGWKPLGQEKVSAGQNRPAKWSRHVTLPPIENLELTAKVLQSGRESPGVFGEKTNALVEHSLVLVEPRANWRHREASAGRGSLSAFTKSAKCERRQNYSVNQRMNK